jgi:hypothetical protein
VDGRFEDPRVAAAAAALAPHAWRDLTARMLARRVIGAADRQTVIEFVSRVPGTLVGETEPVEPADPDDERVGALVEVLERRDWRAAPLRRLCADLVGSLGVWYSQQEAFTADLRRLLDDH